MLRNKEINFVFMFDFFDTMEEAKSFFYWIDSKGKENIRTCYASFWFPDVTRSSQYDFNAVGIKDKNLAIEFKLRWSDNIIGSWQRNNLATCEHNV